MSVNNDSKRKNQRTLRSILVLSAGMVLIIAASGVGMPLAAATHQKTIDPGLGCGNNWWGVKASNLPESNMFWFGKKTDCTVDPAHPTGYKGRTNVLFIHEFRPGDSTQKFAIEWQGAIQGKDPWGNDGTLDSGIAPKVKNTNFPAPATPPSSGTYKLKAQWLWTNDVKPLTDQINANFLTNLWFCKVDANKNCPATSDYMVIDFVWMQLKSTGNSGSWAQNIVTDQDSTSPGTQVYKAYCERVKSSDNISKTNVYHYSIVLDNTSHGSNQWIEKISNVNQYITDAFNHSYVAGGAGGCTHSIPDGATGHRSLFSITDIETGIELSAQNFGKSGRVEGGISNSDLYV